MVVEFQDDSHVIVADGFVRKLNRPKRKNRKHLVAHNIRLDVEEWDDKAIRIFGAAQ